MMRLKQHVLSTCNDATACVTILRVRPLRPKTLRLTIKQQDDLSRMPCDHRLTQASVTSWSVWQSVSLHSVLVQQKQHNLQVAQRQ